MKKIHLKGSLLIVVLSVLSMLAALYFLKVGTNEETTAAQNLSALNPTKDNATMNNWMKKYYGVPQILHPEDNIGAADIFNIALSNASKYPPAPTNSEEPHNMRNSEGPPNMANGELFHNSRAIGHLKE